MHTNSQKSHPSQHNPVDGVNNDSVESTVKLVNMLAGNPHESKSTVNYNDLNIDNSKYNTDARNVQNRSISENLNVTNKYNTNQANFNSLSSNQSSSSYKSNKNGNKKLNQSQTAKPCLNSVMNYQKSQDHCKVGRNVYIRVISCDVLIGKYNLKFKTLI